MSTAEMIFQRASVLPSELQQEALHYVDYLLGAPIYSPGEVLLALLMFSDAQGAKRRPVMVVRDFGDADLLVVPVTSHAARVATDVMLKQWREAGLKLPSTARMEKFATIEKSWVVRKLGALSAADLTPVKEKLAAVCKRITDQVGF